MYIYFDKTGKLKEIINDEALRQGNFDVNKMYVYFENQENVTSLDVRYLLPSGTIVGPQNYITTETTEIPFNAKRDLLFFKYYKEYNFFVIDLEQDINGNSPLDEAGTVHCNITANIVGGQIPVLGEVNFYVEETSTLNQNQVASQEYMSLADYQFLRSLVNEYSNTTKIIVIPNIATADLSNYSNGQLFYDKTTNLYYEKISASPYYQLADTSGLLGGNKGSIARYQYDPSNGYKTVSQMYSLENTRTFILNINGTEYIYQIRPSGSDYLVSAFNLLAREFYCLDGMVGNARIESILTNTRRYRLADLDHNLDLGTHELAFIYNGQEARVFMSPDYNLYLVTSTGDIILNPDGIAEYAGSEIANKDYVDTQDATKLDKVTTTSVTALRLYAVSSAGVQQMLNVGENALDIPQRKYNKQINVPLIPSSPDDATSKSYVDSKVSSLGSALIYMGSKTVAQLNALTSIEIGDFYNVSDSGTLTQGSVQVNAGDNVAWDGSKWDKLSSDIDLSAYYNKTEIDTLLGGKQDTLVSGTNIKSINNQSLLGSGDITIQAGAIEKTGAELEDMTYTEGQLYYCTSSSESFSADTLYMATGENTIVRFTQTSVNTAPAITAFSVSPTTTEYGNTRNCTYTYTLKKYSALSNLSLDGTVIAAAPSSASGSGTATTAYDNHTFTLTATYSGGTVSKTATISPLYRQFYGVVSGDTVAQVLTNLKDVQTDTSSLKTLLQNSLPSSVSLSLGSTPVYVYFIVRSNLTINTLKSGGFDVPFSLVDTQSFTNHYNASYTVRVYRTDNKVFGDMVVNINS